jgi:hypothetical protein
MTEESEKHASFGSCRIFVAHPSSLYRKIERSPQTITQTSYTELLTIPDTFLGGKTKLFSALLRVEQLPYNKKSARYQFNAMFRL